MGFFSTLLKVSCLHERIIRRIEFSATRISVQPTKTEILLGCKNIFLTDVKHLKNMKMVFELFRFVHFLLSYPSNLCYAVVCFLCGTGSCLAIRCALSRWCLEMLANLVHHHDRIYEHGTLKGLLAVFFVYVLAKVRLITYTLSQTAPPTLRERESSKFSPIEHTK